MPNQKVDTVIIGGGPAGLAALAENVYHSVGSVVLLEKGLTHNQTIHQYYPDHKRVDAEYKGQEAICAGVLCFQGYHKVKFLRVDRSDDGAIPSYHTLRCGR